MQTYNTRCEYGLHTVSDHPDNLILSMLRGIRSDISQMKDDIVEVKERLGLLEAQYSSLSRRVDRLGADVERIKRRLELQEAPVV